MNVHHRNNKVPDVCTLLLSQSSPDYHLFEITESRLKFRITDHSISIPDFYSYKTGPATFRTDWNSAVCVHQSIQTIIHRRKDLENYKIECIWLDLKPHAHESPLFVICTETQRTTPLHRYYVDKVNRADVLVFGDFNIDMLEPHSCWVSTLFALVQLISHYSNPHE